MEPSGLKSTPARSVAWPSSRLGVWHMRSAAQDEFRWARAAVKSRVFGLKSLSGGQLEGDVITQGGTWHGVDNLKHMSSDGLAVPVH